MSYSICALSIPIPNKIFFYGKNNENLKSINSTWSQFLLVPCNQMQNQEDMANFFLYSCQSEKKGDTLPELTCCMTLWMSLQAASLLASTAAVALTNRSMDQFQAQVSSNLECMSSLLWNNHFLWGSYCPQHFMNYAHGEYAFTCFPTCKFPRTLKYCCLLLSLQVPAVGNL